MIKVLIGDIFKSKAQTLVNTVNCVGVMGKGIAQEFKRRFPEMYDDYVIRCKRGLIKPGLPYLYKDMFGVSIINFPTKDHWRAMSRLEDVVNGLDFFTEKYMAWGVKSVAFPPLGCGNGGLDWESVGPIMYKKLSSLDIPIEIYAPFGTPKQLLTDTFLSSECNSNQMVLRSKSGSKVFRPEWMAALEVLKKLELQPYVKPVGRTIFQKICYVVQESKVELGFDFIQGNYGPFSVDIKDAMKIMANSNVIVEQQHGKMTALKTGPNYNDFRKKYEAIIKKYSKDIDKVTDLFMRIKDTSQAEEVTTVFFVIKKLKKKQLRVSENDIYQEILNWKKHWNNPEKRTAIASAIRNLGMLRWIKADFSSMPEIETGDKT